MEEAAHGAAEEAEVGPPGGPTVLVPMAVVEGGQEVGEGREHGGEVCRLHVGVWEDRRAGNGDV